MTLLVLPQLRLHATHDGRVTLTQKFLSGMAEYVKLWPGQVTVIAESAESASNNLDNLTVHPAELPFTLKLCNFDNTAELSHHFSEADIVLAGLDYRQAHLWKLARENSVPLVYISEYSLRTRKQIVRTCVSNPLRRLRKYIWETNLERRFVEAVKNSAGIQCNGSPTFEAYDPISPHALLYFDTRVTRDMLVTAEIIQARTAQLLAGAPLRLVFSGRLIAMKGADHLPMLADQLKKRNIPFSLDIFGGGDQEQLIRTSIAKLNLSERVHLHGTIDFQRELVPYIQKNADLFVCCHRQGDPSCTYLETMACGVPIAGYDNEAFAGLARHSQLGWTVRMDDIRALAYQIDHLNQNRAVLANAAQETVNFAAHHTFEATMQKRVAHLLTCTGKSAEELRETSPIH